MTMRRLAMLLGGMMLISNIASAQESACSGCKNGKGDRAQHRTEMMAKRLGLTDEQKAKVLVLNQKFEQQLAAATCKEEQTGEKDCCKKEQPTTEQKSCCKKEQPTTEQKSCCKKEQPTTEQKSCCKKAPEGKPQGHKVCPMKMQKLRQDYMAELKTILTEEQMAKMQTSAKQGKGHHGKEGKKAENKSEK